MKLSYQNASSAEILGFSERIKSKALKGMKEQELVNKVVMDWENVLNSVNYGKR